MVIFTVSLFGALNCYAYNAGLTSTLVVHHYHSKIRTLSDLIDHPDYAIILQTGTAGIQYFSQQDSLPHVKIWERLEKNKNKLFVKSFKEGEEALISDPKKVYFGMVHNLELAFDRYPCDVVRSPNTYLNRSVALALQKGSPYTKLFSRKIDRYTEYGLVDNMKGLNTKPKDNALCPQKDGLQLGYENIFSSFIYLSVGLFLSVSIFCVEYLREKRI